MDSQNTFFGTKVSKPGINVQNASDKQLVYKDNFSTKVYYDNTNSRIVEGLLPDGNYGMWVSKPGENADDTAAVENDNLIFNSNQDIFKVVTSGTTNIPAYGLAAGSLVWDGIVIPHGLNYVPILQAYALVTQYYNFTNPIAEQAIQSYVALPFNVLTGSIPDADIDRYEITAGVDGTNIYIGWYYRAAPAGTGYNFPLTSIRYYLLQETAA